MSSELVKENQPMSTADLEKSSNWVATSMGEPQNHIAEVELIGSGAQAAVVVMDESEIIVTTDNHALSKLTTAGWTMIHAGEHQNMLGSNTDVTKTLEQYFHRAQKHCRTHERITFNSTTPLFLTKEKIRHKKYRRLPFLIKS